ncbi:hypothetical protein [Oxynema aestuarii]|jgi:hypothetical protein|nr:hypothetical protein [Oxynema aestuarii]
MMLDREIEFTLPKGVIDASGRLHRHGTMRPITGEDEIYVTRDRRVREEPAYATFVILSRAIVELGTLDRITPQQLEELFLADFIYLQEQFNELNQELVRFSELGEW